MLFSFIFLLFVLFLYNENYTLTEFISTTRYIVYETRGVVIFISQFLYLSFKKRRSNREIIVNILVYWIIYNIFSLVFIDNNSIRLNPLEMKEIFVERADFTQFNIFEFDIIKRLLLSIENWDLVTHVYSSSFCLILVNGALLAFMERRFSGNFVIKFIVSLAYLLFVVLLWNINYSILFFIVGIYLIEERRIT